MMRRLLLVSFAVAVLAVGGWWLRSAMLNGRDLLDEPLAFDPAVTSAASS